MHFEPLSLLFVGPIFDPLYLILVGPTILLALWAQFRVKSTFHRWSQVATRSGMRGCDVAQMLLHAAGLDAVKVERVGGFLSDHYDPRTRTLRLSEATHDSRSVAAIGVAAHETGHALQHAENYAPLTFRSAIVPFVSIGSHLLPFLILIGIFSGVFVRGHVGTVAYAIIAVLIGIVVFSLVTLPVEFDASKRALAVLANGGVLREDELTGARAVLNAAALTYVAAAASAIMELLYWASRLGLFGGRSSND